MYKYFVLFILLANQTLSQNLEIVKIHDANLFELNNGTMIRLAGVASPSVRDPDSDIRSVALKAREFAYSELFKGSITVTFLLGGPDSSKSRPVFLRREYAASSLDVNQHYLKFGLGRLERYELDDASAVEYGRAEGEADKKHRGLWQFVAGRSTTERELHSNAPSDRETANATRSRWTVPPQERRALTYSNLKLLPLSLLAFGLAWDSFADVSDLDAAIDFYKKYKADTSSWEKARMRKTILGASFVLAGLINTLIAVSPVEVSATSNSIGLSYRF